MNFTYDFSKYDTYVKEVGEDKLNAALNGTLPTRDFKKLSKQMGADYDDYISKNPITEEEKWAKYGVDPALVSVIGDTIDNVSKSYKGNTLFVNALREPLIKLLEDWKFNEFFAIIDNNLVGALANGLEGSCFMYNPYNEDEVYAYLVAAISFYRGIFWVDAKNKEN